MVLRYGLVISKRRAISAAHCAMMAEYGAIPFGYARRKSPWGTAPYGTEK